MRLTTVSDVSEYVSSARHSQTLDPALGNNKRASDKDKDNSLTANTNIYWEDRDTQNLTS